MTWNKKNIIFDLLIWFFDLIKSEETLEKETWEGRKNESQ